MYQKQQIPLSCDSLIKLHATSKPTDRNFSSMQNLVDSLSNISNQLALQFTIDDCEVKEIVIVIGATIVSPKFYIVIELPPTILNSNIHLEYQHPFRKSLTTVMRSIIKSTEFQDEMIIPLGLTNTFVFVRKKDPYKISEFFIPKPQFSLSSQNTNSFRIKLNYNENNRLNCDCDNFIKVYHDSQNKIYLKKDYIEEKFNSEITYQWYQSKEVLKGFKFLI
ncbi:PREDICTED: uncharacterized protein LOC105362892 isoform X2 [Ceratosolen solmsi marchali]|nr:PREDICTED: uncharacterized protein LOC105362892 isoform X2 [Ceratosolen solmsi marchali]